MMVPTASVYTVAVMTSTVRAVTVLSYSSDDLLLYCCIGLLLHFFAHNCCSDLLSGPMTAVWPVAGVCGRGLWQGLWQGMARKPVARGVSKARAALCTV